MSGLPLPRPRDEVVVVPAPGPGPGHWAGAPSAARDERGGWVVAYRLRTPTQRGAAVVVATSPDGEHLTPVATLRQDRFGAASLERPALVRLRDGRWRLYLSCATPGSKHWRIDVVEAAEPWGLAEAEPRTVLPGDELLAVKDPVIRATPDGWQAWICCHPLDRSGDEDRMHTRFATSPDGLTWSWRGIALSGRPGAWDVRGARVTAVLPDGRATYDGRATARENFSERTGLAIASDVPWVLLPQGDAPVAGFRYLDVVALQGGGHRLYYEAPLPDGSHELRSAVVRDGPALPLAPGGQRS
jgi:hypothetical protein